MCITGAYTLLTDIMSYNCGSKLQIVTTLTPLQLTIYLAKYN